MSNHPIRNASKLIVYSRDDGGLLTRHVTACCMTLNPSDVRAARKAAGLSQTAAGALCHRSLRAWQDAEAGKRNLDQAAWELFLLRTGQHPTHRLIARPAAS
jgi:putative transcriptional regulator